MEYWKCEKCFIDISYFHFLPSYKTWLGEEDQDVAGLEDVVLLFVVVFLVPTREINLRNQILILMKKSKRSMTLRQDLESQKNKLSQ